MSWLRSTHRIAACIATNTLCRLQAPGQVRYVKRWVGPTLRELRHRGKKLGPQAPQPRSGFIEWNYRAELFAFGKRLNEAFQMASLQTAFTERSYILQEEQRQRELGIEESDIQMPDNGQLAERGRRAVKEYVNAYLQYSLTKMPTEGREAIAGHLLSTATLAHVASHLGMKDLILSAEYPPSEATAANALLAVIGALEESSGMERVFPFIRDFICTQLNQRDLLEFWNIDNPEEMLRKVCKERKLGEPEPRLLGDCGKNTVLAAYHVGIYVNREMIGKGFGEDINTAIQAAALDSIQKLCSIEDSMRPFDFKLQVEPKTGTLPHN